MPLYLVPVDRSDSPVSLDKPILLFGRQAECDVIITASRKVSRRHCCLAQISDWFVLRDLGSTNGVKVNGEKIQREAKLQLGDFITIGDVTFELTEGQFDVPKGKVTIGEPLQAAAADRPVQRGAKHFRGLASSRPNHGSKKPTPSEDVSPAETPSNNVSDADQDAAASETSPQKRAAEIPSEPSSPSERVAPDVDSDSIDGPLFLDENDILDEPPSVLDESHSADDHEASDESGTLEPAPDDDSGEVFALADSDAEQDDDIVDFGFLDDDGDEPEPADTPPPPPKAATSRKPKSSQSPRRKSRPSSPPSEDDDFDDDVFDPFAEDDEPPEPKRSPKRRPKKSQPADTRLKKDERVGDIQNADVKPTGTGQSGMDSIIELNEFDLLD